MGIKTWLDGIRARNRAALFTHFSSSNGFYSFEYPSSWSIGSEGDALLIEGPAQAIHVSAWDGSFPDSWPEGLLNKTFKTEVPVADAQQVEGAGWSGVGRQYEDKTDAPPRHWLALAARNDRGALLITWNAQGSEMPDPMAFRHVVSTLVLRTR